MYNQAHLFVSGHVQGVGYRFFVSKLARSLGLTGWTKNLFNGQVEIVVEGNRGLIESMIKELKTGNPYASVRDIQVEWGAFQGEFKEFDITF